MPPPAAVPASLVEKLMVTRKAFVINRKPAYLSRLSLLRRSLLPATAGEGISVSVLERQRDKGAKPARLGVKHQVRF
jgi:hypothetical protein